MKKAAKAFRTAQDTMESQITWLVKNTKIAYHNFIEHVKSCLSDRKVARFSLIILIGFCVTAYLAIFPLCTSVAY